jgi:hypothetical protein
VAKGVYAMPDSGNGGELTSIFEAISDGAEGAQERLFSVVYDELRRMAHGRMRHERPGQTLQTTALVNEAYLRLCTDKQARWKNRRHFFGAAAKAIERIFTLLESHGIELVDADTSGSWEHNEVPEQSRSVLKNLTPREVRVLKMRFGIGGGIDHPQDRVGQSFTVTRERIRQIEAKALRLLDGDDGVCAAKRKSPKSSS